MTELLAYSEATKVVLTYRQQQVSSDLLSGQVSVYAGPVVLTTDLLTDRHYPNALLLLARRLQECPPATKVVISRQLREHPPVEFNLEDSQAELLRRDPLSAITAMTVAPTLVVDCRSAPPKTSVTTGYAALADAFGEVVYLPKAEPKVVACPMCAAKARVLEDNKRIFCPSCKSCVPIQEQDDAFCGVKVEHLLYCNWPTFYLPGAWNTVAPETGRISKAELQAMFDSFVKERANV